MKMDTKLLINKALNGFLALERNVHYSGQGDLHLGDTFVRVNPGKRKKFGGN